jgi:hypothetical protein
MNQSTQPQGVALQMNTRQIGLRDIVALIIRRSGSSNPVDHRLRRSARCSRRAHHRQRPVMVVGRDPRRPLTASPQLGSDHSTAAQVSTACGDGSAATALSTPSDHRRRTPFPVVDSVDQFKRMLSGRELPPGRRIEYPEHHLLHVSERCAARGGRDHEGLRRIQHPRGASRPSSITASRSPKSNPRSSLLGERAPSHRGRRDDAGNQLNNTIGTSEPSPMFEAGRTAGLRIAAPAHPPPSG